MTGKEEKTRHNEELAAGLFVVTIVAAVALGLVTFFDAHDGSPPAENLQDLREGFISVALAVSLLSSIGGRRVLCGAVKQITTGDF